jgi:hypothetical protein
VSHVLGMRVVVCRGSESSDSAEHGCERLGKGWPGGCSSAVPCDPGRGCSEDRDSSAIVWGMGREAVEGIRGIDAAWSSWLWCIRGCGKTGGVCGMATSSLSLTSSRRLGFLSCSRVVHVLRRLPVSWLIICRRDSLDSNRMREVPVQPSDTTQ